jgi:hypothetical protein
MAEGAGSIGFSAGGVDFRLDEAGADHVDPDRFRAELSRKAEGQSVDRAF